MMTDAVPLTPEQRQMLRLNTILPTLVAIPIVLVLAGVLASIASSRAFGHPAVKAFVGCAALLLAGIVIAGAMHVRNHLLDYRAGVAAVCFERLISKRETGRAPKTFYATFERTGDVILMHDAWLPLEPGRAYRVTFSPRTRRGWSVEPS
jgi:hypothetical protein